MPYNASVDSKISLATTSSTSANLGATIFVAAHNFFLERTRPYSSFSEVKEDGAIPTNSNAYKALLLAFSASGAATPIYLGRREVDSASYTVDEDRVGLVTPFSLKVSTGANTETYTHLSTSGDTASDVLDALALQITTDLTITATASVAGDIMTVVASDSDSVIVTELSYLDVTFVSTEDAADLIGALLDESGEDWYFVTCEDHSQEFVLAMAAEIEATETSDYPKQYHVTVDEAEVLAPLPEPAVDTLGKLAELNYFRTAGRWHHDASLFTEVFPTAYVGQYQPGATTWKFVIPSGITAAADPLTGKRLSTSKQGYIRDRNASWFGMERGVNFNHGGTMAAGTAGWIDIVQLKDWLNDQIETRLLNLLLNQPGGKIPFTTAGKALVKNTVDGVLIEAVGFGGLSGYVPCSIPDATSFADQAARILSQVDWTGYLAGAVHFITPTGVLTYEDATLV